MRKLLAILLVLSMLFGCFSALAEETSTVSYSELPSTLLSSIYQAVMSGNGASVTLMDGQRNQMGSLGILQNAQDGSPVFALKVEPDNGIYANEQGVIITNAGTTTGVLFDTVMSLINSQISSAESTAGGLPEQISALAAELVQNLTTALSTITPDVDHQVTEDGYITTMSLNVQQIAAPLIEAVVNTIDQNGTVIDQVIQLLSQYTNEKLPTSQELVMYLKGISSSISLMAGQYNISYTEKVAGSSTVYTLNIASGMAVFTYEASPNRYHINAAVNGNQLSGTVILSGNTVNCQADLNGQSLVQLNLTTNQNGCSFSGTVADTAINGLISVTDSSITATVIADSDTYRLNILLAQDNSGFSAVLTQNDLLMATTAASISDKKGFVSLNAGEFILSADYNWSNYLLQANANLNGIPFHLSMDFPYVRMMYYGREQDINPFELFSSTLRSNIYGRRKQFTMSAQLGKLQLFYDNYMDSKLSIFVQDLCLVEYYADTMTGSKQLTIDLRTRLSRNMRYGKYTLDITPNGIAYTYLDYQQLKGYSYVLADETAQYDGHLNVMSFSMINSRANKTEAAQSIMIVTDAIENGYEISIRESMEEDAAIVAIIHIDLSAAPIQLPQDVRYLDENELLQYLSQLLNN